MSNLRRFVKTAGCIAALGLSGWLTYEVTRPPYTGAAGITYGSAPAPVRGGNIDFHIWYPATAGGKTVTVGGNGVFHGTPAGRGAPMQDGQFPLVIISHGAGGNAGQFGWIASDLAEAGFVVVLPNHPGTTSGNASAEAAIRVWERPADVSAVLDHITSTPDEFAFVDTDRISILGFSAGGYTAMATAGARVDPDLLQRFCDDTDHGMSDCAFLARFGVDLHDYDLSPAGQDLRDPRIKTAVIIDPGIVETLTDASLAAINIPMLVLNLGDAGTVPIGVDAKHAATQIPNATYEMVNDAIHFSFLAECKPKGAAILRNENEPDPLCDDAGGRSREDIHNDLSNRIIRYLAAAT